MKIKKYIRKIAYVLLMCFAVAELSSVATVLAAERQKREEEKQWMRDAGAGLVDWRDQYDPLKEEDVPRAVGYEEAVWKNHVERMYDEEGDELNNVVFKNADGSRTKYVFDYPVKYVDKKGKVHDSSFEIGDSKDGRFKYETVASVSKTRFPKDIRDGIELSGEDVMVTLVPHDAKNAEPKRVDEETISYEYDENTTIEYSLTYTGFKEDIVVSEYTGQTEYEFTIYTEGLTLTEIDGSYYLVDENEGIKATIGDIIIFTADEKSNAFGELRAETIVENEEYRMTIVLDPEYLKDPATVYPIRIDPTVEITYDNNGSGAIEDVTINSLKGSSGSSGSLSVGLREKYGISRILMKFPGLDLSGLEENVKITEATVELRDLMCEGTNLEVSCYVFSGNEWTESTANWSNVSPNNISTFLCSRVMTYATGKTLPTKHRYSFDITEAVKGWVVKTCNQDKGIIFKASPALENGSTYDCRTIASYNRASNKPSLSVTYSTTSGKVSNGSYYLNNKNYGQYLQYGGTSAYAKSGLLSTYGGSFQWEIVNVGDGCVIRFKADPTRYLAVPEATSSSSVVIVSLKDDVIPDRCIWTFTSATGGGYLVKNMHNKRYLYSDGGKPCTDVYTGLAGSEFYASRVWRVASTSYYGNTDSYTKKELTSSFTINNMVLDVGDVMMPTINRSTKENLWSDASDFTYTVTSGPSGCVSFNSTTAKVTTKKIGIVTIEAMHKVTGRKKSFKIYVDRYVYELVNAFGFMDENALLIRDLYVKVDKVFAEDDEKYKAWVCSRLLGGIVYGNESSTVWSQFKWRDVAGQVFSTTEEEYFTEVLGYTEEEYVKFKNAIVDQHNKLIDFAHMQISLAARLAYDLNRDGLFANIGTFCSDEDVSYLAGWLGDATLTANGTTSFGNDDYCADLDAENIYRLIQQGNSSIVAINSYYKSLTSTKTRAKIFLQNIPYDEVQNKVFYQLIDEDLTIKAEAAVSMGNTQMAEYYNSLIVDEQYHWSQLKALYSDTYDFLHSLQDGLSDMREY